jgi:Fur family ferric uptake transcriptional regulator
MSAAAIGILRKYRLHITKQRVLILKAFMSTERSLDLQYFLHEHAYPFERTTVFRILKLFTKKNIVYRVCAYGSDRYLLLQNGKRKSTASGRSTFVCTRCGKAITVDTITSPTIKIPKGFTRSDLEIIIHGLCPTCKQ